MPRPALPFLLLALPQVLAMIDIPTTIAAAARQLIYGVLLIAFMLFRPQGLLGTPEGRTV